MYTYEVPAYKVPAHEVYAREMYAYEMLEPRSVVMNEGRDRWCKN